MGLINRHNFGCELGLLLVLFFGFTSIPALAQNNLEMRAESLFNQHKASQAFNLYNKLLKKHPKDVSALWHSSLLYSRLGHRLDSEKKKKKYFMMAKKRAYKALKIDHKSSMANYAMAVALGRMAKIADIQQKITASRKIRKYAIRALKLDSTNAGAWDALSQWNYGFANMSSKKRAMAKILLGDLVEETSYKKAVKYAKNAIKYNSAVVNYYLDLAKAYKGMGKNEKAVNTCQKALKKPPVWLEGKAAKRGCHELIENISVK